MEGAEETRVRGMAVRRLTGRCCCLVEKGAASQGLQGRATRGARPTWGRRTHFGGHFCIQPTLVAVPAPLFVRVWADRARPAPVWLGQAACNLPSLCGGFSPPGQCLPHLGLVTRLRKGVGVFTGLFPAAGSQGCMWSLWQVRSKLVCPGPCALERGWGWGAVG